METLSNKEIRSFIMKHFSDSELKTFCFDYFPEVQNNFSYGMQKNDKVIDLIKYCYNRKFTTNLLINLQRERPLVYREILDPPESGSLTPPPVKPRNPQQVFISYSTKDASPLANKLAKDLRNKGRSVWIAPDSIVPGEKWGEAIERGLQESGIFVLLLTPDTANSYWIKKEMQAAMQLERHGQIRIIPIDVEEFEIPLFWEGYHFIPFRDKYEDGWKRLWQAIENEPSPLPQPLSPSPLPPPSSERVGEQGVPTWVKWSGLVLAMLIIIGGGYKLFVEPELSNGVENVPAISEAVDSTVQIIAESTKTPIGEPIGIPIIPTEVSPNTPTPASALGDTRERSIDGATMVYVPGGTFAMGNDDGSNDENDERPVHDITLDNFWIDRTEVTNGQFIQFVDSTNYTTTAEKEGTGFVYTVGIGWEEINGVDWRHLNGLTHNLTELSQHPVVFVSWEDANTYCEWVDSRLPTEAEWEYASRGQNNSIYPWGDNLPTCNLLNYYDNDSGDYCIGTTIAVASYSPDGDSWIGASDMAGNVWEWVSDWYDENYYKNSPFNNPTGPLNGELMTLRGGSWGSNTISTQSFNRCTSDSTFRNNFTVFRCAS